MDILNKKDIRVIIEPDKCYFERVRVIIIITEKLPNDVVTREENIFNKFPKCVANNVNKRPNRIPFSKRAKVQEIMHQLLSANIIRKSALPYASPIVLVTKANGEELMCIDFRSLNAITVKEPGIIGQ